MSDLENACKPSLKSMILGRGRELHDRGRRLTAAWGNKTALTLQCRAKESLVPEAHYRAVKAHAALPRQEPPAATQVWLGAFDFAQRNLFHLHAPLMIGDDAVLVRDFNGYGSTFNVGHLVFQVFWSNRDPPAVRHIGQDLQRILREIWPARGLSPGRRPRFSTSTASLRFRRPMSDRERAASSREG
jgi:hypothetical protein